jgi:hypothetical protein
LETPEHQDSQWHLLSYMMNDTDGRATVLSYAALVRHFFIYCKKVL